MHLADYLKGELIKKEKMGRKKYGEFKMCSLCCREEENKKYL
jgi:hypothetical protein